MTLVLSVLAVVAGMYLFCGAAYVLVAFFVLPWPRGWRNRIACAVLSIPLGLRAWPVLLDELA